MNKTTDETMNKTMENEKQKHEYETSKNNWKKHMNAVEKAWQLMKTMNNLLRPMKKHMDKNMKTSKQKKREKPWKWNQMKSMENMEKHRRTNMEKTNNKTWRNAMENTWNNMKKDMAQTNKTKMNNVK